MAGVVRDTGTSERHVFVARLRPGGARDGTWGVNGVSLLDLPFEAFPNDLAVLPGGQVLLVGGAGDEEVEDFLVIRLTPAGALDASFGEGGVVLTDLGGAETAAALSLAPLGRIVVAGSTEPQSQVEGGPDRSRVAIVRYRSTGDLDTTFGANGRVITGLGADSIQARDVALVGGGRPLVVGAADPFTPSGDLFVARFQPDGRIDRTFGTRGRVRRDLGGQDQATDVLVQPDGRMLVGGQGGPGIEAFVARFTADGLPDPSFHVDGVHILDPDPFRNSSLGGMGLQQDGRVLAGVGCNDAQDNEDLCVARLTAGGVLDASFGDAGFAQAPVDGSQVTVALAMQGDSRAVLLGPSFAFPEPPAMVLARFLTD